MRAVRWCSRCEHAFDLDEDSANDAEVACPFCGAPVADVKTWESVRPSHPEWPTRPVFGGAYPTRPDTAAAVPQSNVRLLDEVDLPMLLERAPIGIAIARSGINAYANSACARMFGYERRSDIIGMRFMDMIAPECRRMVLDRLRDRLGGASETMRYECTGIRKDGSRFPYRVHSAAIEFEDGPGTFVFLIDLSDED
jgi:PAS domain S-box-containing protein